MRKVPSGSNIPVGTFFMYAFPNFLGNISTEFPHIPHHSLLAQNV